MSKKVKKQIITSQPRINGCISDDKYIYLMSLVDVLPEIAKKDIMDAEADVSCSWRGYCKRCEMVHI